MTYYHAITPAFEPHPHLIRDIPGGDMETDICVVGGGLTGMSAALHLAERGFRTILLEAGRIGDGASGRNGGQIVTGYGCDMTMFERMAGAEAAKTIWDMGLEAVEDIGRRITRHGIDADARHGYLHLALNARQARGLREMAENWSATYGFSGTRLLGREETAAATGSALYHGALEDRGSGHINPLAYLRGLARAAEAAGAGIFEASPVIALKRGARPVLETPHGHITARHVVLAGNAYLGALVPEIASRIAPVQSAIAVTAPLDEALDRLILPGGEAVADCNTALDYFRRTPDRRLLFGGLAGYSGRPLDRAGPALHRRMTRIYPGLAHIRIEHVWSGRIAITATRMPDFGRLDGNIFHAHGFSGHGLAITGLAGKLIAEAVAGSAERFDIFSRLPNLRFPGGPARTALLVLAMTWHRIRDMLG